ncbi:MAG: MFS transporter [Candidatus Paceibacterota bacterium]|jgi:MFS family permease
MQNEKRFLGVHPDVLKLGLVSFLTDVSSEAIFSVFSVFFTTIVGASVALLGIVEGLADFSASSLDYIAGWLSDKTGKRKPLAMVGYCFSVLAKMFLVVASSVSALATFRVVERLGKSFRGAPRDAWLSDVAEKSTRGYSFGVHKALDKAGAVIGPFVAYFILASFGQTIYAFRILFVVAAIFAALAVVVLALVKERPGTVREKENIFKAWSYLSPGFKAYLIPAGIFALAYFSFSFLLLKAYNVGFAVKDVVLLYALFNLSFVIVSSSIGKLGDKIGRSYILMCSYVIYTVMSLGFIFADQKWEVIILFVLFGIFYSIDEGQSKAFIADLEKDRRATAIGAYNLITGLVYFMASVIAGFLWSLQPAYAFEFAALVSFVAMITFIFSMSKMSSVE